MRKQGHSARGWGAPALVMLLLNLWPGLVSAVQESCTDGRCTTTYEADFFIRYAPTSALDMIRNIPGYRLDDGDSARGFGGTAGNVLIDGERISAKNTRPSDLLRRIPATKVERIVVIRGQLGGLDLANQALVANVIRQQTGTSGTWSTRLNQYQPDARVNPGGNFSLAGRLGDLRYNLGVKGGRYVSFIESDEEVRDASGSLIEPRDEVFEELGTFYGASFTAQSKLAEADVSLNLAFDHFDESGDEISQRAPLTAPAFVLRQFDEDGEDAWEFALDAKQQFATHWQAKVIGLYSRSLFHERAGLDRKEQIGTFEPQVLTRFDSDARETITRVELDFTGISGHLLEGSVEAAINKLDSRFGFAEVINGIPVNRDVPGANSEVKEERLEVVLSDAFQLGGVSVDLALGGEWSKIEQTGDFSESRSFFYFKPSLLLTYPISERRQLRASARREVGQLDFFAFVSAADLGDEELELGNPNLVPERTTTLDLTYEARASSFGSFNATLFHNWIDDVEDLVPLSGVLEVPGNIGKGRRYGLRTELTLPLDQLGLPSGRLDMDGRWQHSEVDDPLSGRPRDLSGERDWQGSITLRQDLTTTGLAWSVKAFTFDNFSQFGLDELDVRGRRYDIDAVLEFRIGATLRLQFGVENLLRNGEDRRRQVFAGPRNIAQLAFVEGREQSFAREFFVRLNGTL